ncbi:uncharacterized protein [Nothobranchius furzeri]|uniref:uncharacterized protein isoform X2 n=1 Tax=Nothobranchius furzeri TaxID=105023 RepID=UPI003904744A
MDMAWNWEPVKLFEYWSYVVPGESVGSWGDLPGGGHPGQVASPPQGHIEMGGTGEQQAICYSSLGFLRSRETHLSAGILLNLGLSSTFRTCHKTRIHACLPLQPLLTSQLSAASAPSPSQDSEDSPCLALLLPLTSQPDPPLSSSLLPTQNAGPQDFGL